MQVPQVVLWSPKLYYSPPGCIMVPQVVLWSPRSYYGPPGFIMVPQVLLWSPRSYYGPPGRIMVPQVVLWSPRLCYGPLGCIMVPQVVLWSPSFFVLWDSRLSAVPFLRNIGYLLISIEGIVHILCFRINITPGHSLLCLSESHSLLTLLLNCSISLSPC